MAHVMLNQFYALWRNIYRRQRLDQELDDELQSYIELVAAGKQRRGMSAGQAYREAREEFESVARVKEKVRDVRTGAAMDTLAQDTRPKSGLHSERIRRGATSVGCERQRGVLLATGRSHGAGPRLSASGR